tara:strand:- start:322 stop:543 length:222 start_codon:yes stop_codon:yes gene_type:complete
MPKYININRTDEECLENCIKSINQNNTYKCEKNRKQNIKETKKQSISEIRYIDNQLRIFQARKYWKLLSEKIF